MTKFCRTYCGVCAECLAAIAELKELDAVYASLSPEDVDSGRDEDDPRTYALDHKGRP